MTIAVESIPVTPFRFCEECSTPLGIVHGNTKYCEPCKEEKIIEKNRKYNKKRVNKQLGTSHFGKHRHQSFYKEAQLVRNELDRQLKNTVVVYNEEDVTNMTPSVSTHILLDEVKKRPCPECRNDIYFHKDYKRAEISCKICGLVLLGPNPMGIYPWKLIPMNVSCEGCGKHYDYNAELNGYEPSQCPTCGYINYVFDRSWEITNKIKE